MRMPRPHRPLRRSGRLARASFVLLLATTAGCGGESSSPTGDTPSSHPTTSGPGVRLELRFDDPLADAAALQRITSAGAGSYEIAVVTAGGGGLVTQPGREGGLDRAVRFPAFAPEIGGPRALIRVAAAGASDDLDPGTSDFAFGADVRLDATSQSAGSADDGNNVVQRGLYADSTQYKLEIDGGLVTCRVKGSTGDVQVTSTSPLAPGHWYRLRCSRTADRVTVTVNGWTSHGMTTVRSSEDGRTGDLTPASRNLPLSIGGKLSADHASIEQQSDQFNGLIDNVILVIG